MIPHMWFGVPKDVVMPEPALPAQVHHLWHHSRAISPERSLLLAVLWQALLDLRKFRFAKRLRHQRAYMDAYEWVASEERSWAYSFPNVCDMLNLDVESVRRQLLDTTSQPPSAGDVPREVDQAA